MQKHKRLLINQRYISEFCRQNNIRGMIGFLSVLLSDAKKFRMFIIAQNISVSQLPDKILLHGSQMLRDQLMPSVSDGGGNRDKSQPLVYATDNPNYAIFLAVIGIQKRGMASVAVEKKKTTLSVNLGFINGSSQIKGGYIHIVDGREFEKRENGEFTSAQPTKVIFTLRVKPSDLTKKIWIQMK